MRKVIGLVAGLLLVVFSYQNCAPPGQVADGVFAEKSQSMSGIANSPAGAEELEKELNQKVTVANGKTLCTISSLSEIAPCLSASASEITIQLQNDLSCDGVQCCPNGKSLFAISGKTNVVLDGLGRSIRRNGEGLKNCAALSIHKSTNVTVKNLNFVDSLSVSNCTVAYMTEKKHNCSTIVNAASSNIAFERVSLFNGKGYAATANNIQGFRWINSRIHNAGIIGLYIGSYYNNQRSTKVVVQDSIFTRVATNALVFQGVAGTNSNYITGNLFLNNHHHGAWSLCGTSGKNICNGGQIYIPDAVNVVINKNIIGDGFCENCPKVGEFEYPVWPIELGAPATNEQLVSNVLVEGNYIYNHGYVAILKNYQSNVSKLMIRNNRFNGIDHIYKVVNAPKELPSQIEGNIFNPKDRFNRFYQKPSYFIQRMYANGWHWESRTKAEFPTGSWEAEYRLAGHPHRGISKADGGAIFRCMLDNSTKDFLSVTRNCEGVGVLSAVVGFSKETGTQALYRCRVDGDHFVSTSKSCEGKIFEGELGRIN